MKVCTSRGNTSAIAISTALAMIWALPVNAESFNLRIGSGHPSGPSVYVTAMSKFFVPEVVRRVEAETEHTIKFTEAYGGSVAKVNETLLAVQNGVLDIGGFCFCFEQSRLFIHNFPYWLPFSSPSARVTMRATRKVYDEFPELSKVFEDKYQQKLIGLSGYDNYGLGTTFPWSDLAELKGVKIAAAGPNLPWLEGTGSVGVSTTLPEGYNALMSGIYNGWIMFPSAYHGYKLYEPAPHYKVTDFGSFMVNGLTINLTTFRSLPADVQKIIEEVGLEYENFQAEELDASNKTTMEKMQTDAKVTVIDPAVRIAWAETLKTWPSKMALEGEQHGFPAGEIMRAYVKALAEEGYHFPVEYDIGN